MADFKPSDLEMCENPVGPFVPYDGRAPARYVRVKPDVWHDYQIDALFGPGTSAHQRRWSAAIMASARRAGAFD